MSVEYPQGLKKSRFIRNVAAIATGAAASQALALLALPFVTRLYLPKQFGVLAVYAGIVGILAVIACLRFENAIPLPRSDRSAAQIGVVAIFSLLIVTAVTAGGGFLFSRLLPSDMDGLSGDAFAVLLSAGVLGSGLYQIGTYWSVRSKSFSLIGRTRFQQTFFSVAAQLTLGFAGIGALGLIAGQLTSQIAGFVSLIRNFISEVFKHSSTVISWRRLGWALRRYRRFPIYDAPAAFLNSASSQIPAILFATCFSAELAGYFALSMRLLSAPIGLIGASVSQVLTPKLVEARRCGGTSDILEATFRFLSCLCFTPFALFIALAPVIFPLIFGAEWSGAANVAAWTATWVCLQFVYAPLSVYFICAEAQRLNMWIQIFFFVFRFFPLLVIFKMGAELSPIVIFSVMSVLCYIGALSVLVRHAAMKASRIAALLAVEIVIGCSTGVIAINLIENGLVVGVVGFAFLAGVYVYRLLNAKAEFARTLD